MRSTRFWLWLALVAGLGSRLVGIDFGLPLHLHPDEPTQVLTAQHMLTGDLNPHFFRYSSLYIYQLFTLDGAAQLVANLTGYKLRSSDYWIIARIFTAGYGTLTIWAVYLLGQTVISDWTGIVAAWVVAFNPEHIRQSHYATVDIAMTFWIVMALMFAVRAFKRDRASWLALSVTMGLAIGTKFSAIVFAAVACTFLIISLYRVETWEQLNKVQRNGAWILIIIGAILGLAISLLPIDLILQLGKQWSTDGALKPEYISLFNNLIWLWRVTAVACVLIGTLGYWNCRVRRVVYVLFYPLPLTFFAVILATVFITSPYILLDLPVAARDILYEYRHMLLGAAAQLSNNDPIRSELFPIGLFPEPLYYVHWWLGQNGLLVTGFGLVGAVFLGRRATRTNAFLLMALLLFGVTLTRAASKADRYALPFVPLLALWIGVAVESLLRTGRWPLLRASLVFALLAIPLISSWNLLQNEFILPNTNWLAYEWLQRRVEPGSTIVREYSTPDIESGTETYRVIVTQSAFEEHTLDEWQRKGVQYIMIGKLRDSYYRPNASYYGQIVDNYSALDKIGILQVEFQADSHTVGSPIWIYRLP